MLLEAVELDEVLEACGTGGARGGARSAAGSPGVLGAVRARLDGVRDRACFVSPNLFGL